MHVLFEQFGYCEAKKDCLIAGRTATYANCVLKMLCGRCTELLPICSEACSASSAELSKMKLSPLLAVLFSVLCSVSLCWPSTDAYLCGCCPLFSLLNLRFVSILWKLTSFVSSRTLPFHWTATSTSSTRSSNHLPMDSTRNDRESQSLSANEAPPLFLRRR